MTLFQVVGEYNNYYYFIKKKKRKLQQRPISKKINELTKTTPNMELNIVRKK